MISFLKMVSFRNLNPLRTDPRSTLARRFPTERFAVVNLGGMGAKVGAARFVKGIPVVENVVVLPHDSNDQFPSGLIAALKDRSPSGAVVLGCSLKAVFSLQKFDQADLDSLASLNGDNRDPHHYAQILPSAESDKTFRGMIERALVAQFADRLKEHNLDLVRCQIPSMAVFNRMLVDPLVTTPPDGSVNIPIICDQGMIHAISVSRGKWVALRCTAVVSRSGPHRRDDEDEEIFDVLNSCRRSIDQTFSARDSASRPTRYNFMVIDTGTPALFDRLTHITARLTTTMTGVTITIERFPSDPHPDLLCLVNDTKESS